MVAGRRRVVITGIGCITPLGLGVEPLWKNLMAGASGVGMTTVFDASRFPTKISAEALRLECGLVASTRSKSWWKTQSSEL